MVVCKFCEGEFNDRHDLHLHWDEEHSQRLTPHDKNKVKKAFRKEEDKKHAAQEKRKRRFRTRIGWVAFFTTLMIIGYIGTQAVDSPQQQVIEFSSQPVSDNPNTSMQVRLEQGPELYINGENVGTQIKELIQ